MRHFLFSVFFLTQITCFGQIFEDFNDGNFTSPLPLDWQGTTADFTVKDTLVGSYLLQLNNTTPVTPSTSYLSIPHSLGNLNNVEWRFWTRQGFTPSGSSYGRFYLTSESADLSTDPNGYFLHFGESNEDTIRLYKKDNSGLTLLAKGNGGIIDGSFSIGIRVVRDSLGNWDLFVDPTGGVNYGLLASSTEVTTPVLGTHSGMLCQYAASYATKFFYDDVYIGDEILDITPPVLLSATVVGLTEIDALFDEALDPTTAEDEGNYSFSPSLGTIISATLDGANPALVHLVTTDTLVNGQNYTLTATGIADVEINISGVQTTDFAYLIAETPAPGDIVINEVMFDPTDPIGQPEVDYIEIYNRSTKIFNVNGWKIGDSNSDGTIEDYWLLPNSYLILTKIDSVVLFSAAATGVSSFPNFNSTTVENVVLRSNTGLTLDSMTYNGPDWTEPIYDGVSIELINPNDPCPDVGDWRSSLHSSGGTPGAQNSVFDTIPAITNIDIDFLLAQDPNYLSIFYSEGMDSTSLANATFIFTPPLTYNNNYVPTDPASWQTLIFNENLVGSQTYTIEIQNVANCWGDSTTLFGQFALPEIASLGDVIINEVLADPVSGGKDWIEIYNNSDKLIDLINYQIADYDDDTISNFKQIEEHILIGPDEYIVLGEDIAQIAQHYPTVVPDNLYEMDLPSYSNDSGSVYLIHNNAVMDRVSYNDDWHFRLLDNTDGVSLERIDPDGGSSDGHNWHSAAEAIGFGTPGLVNSQFYPAIANGEFDYTSGVVSPDSDGYQDVLQINYEMVEPGYVGHFTVYDDRGRLIARVVESELLGATGTFSWGGVKDDGTKASIGTYVGVFEAFQLEGGVAFTNKKAFVVAGKI